MSSRRGRRAYQLATAQFAAQKPEKKPYHNLLKIDLVWRNLSKGAVYAGRTECLVVILRRGRHLCTLFSSACDFGQQNDNRQADQPD
jgi:hypothetical protein